MNSSIVALLLFSILTISMVLYAKHYNKMMKIYQKEAREQQREFTVDRTLNKFFKGVEKATARKRLSEVDKIKAQFELEIGAVYAKKEKTIEKQFAEKKDYTEIIDEGDKTYFSFVADMGNAEPVTEEEKMQDMSDLMAAVNALEDLDADHYQKDDMDGESSGTGGMDLGKSMYYDKISRKLGKIIKTQNFKELKYVQAEKLKAIAFQTMKELSDKDFLETLKLMKEIGTIKDIIEINPEVRFLSFTKEKLKLTMAEKVVLTFANDHDILTVNRLKESTEWKPAYVTRILNSLTKKGIIEIKDDVLTSERIINSAERALLIEKRKEADEKKKAEKEKRIKLADQKRKQDKEFQEAKKKMEQAKLQKDHEALLENARQEVDVHTKKQKEEIQKQIEKDEEKRLEKIKHTPKPMIKSLSQGLPGLPKLKLPVIKKPPISNAANDLSKIKLPKIIKPGATKELSNIKLPVIKKPTISDAAKNLAQNAAKLSKSLSKEDKESINGEKIPKEKKSKKESSSDLSMEDMMKMEAMLNEVPGEDGFDDNLGDENPLDMDMDQMEAMLNQVPGEDGFGEVDLSKFTSMLENTPKDKKKKEGVSDGSIEDSIVGDLDSYFGDIDDDEAVSDELSENQELIDALVNLFNDSVERTGGVINLDFMIGFLRQQFPEVEEEKVNEVVEEMKETQIIYETFEIEGTMLVVYDDITLDENAKEIFKIFVLNNNKKLTRKEFIKEVKWDEKELDEIIAPLIEQNLFKRSKEDEKYSVPGLFIMDKD